jgi:hypothetical protein
MKKLYILLLVVFANSIRSQNVAISTTTAVPNASAMLDIVSTTKGLLIPRMTEAQRVAIASPATSLLVYQTDAGTLGTGFYYYTGGTWLPLYSSSGAWNISGNAGTSAATHFLGTTDAVALIIKTSNAERMRFFTNGQVSINSSTVNAYSTLYTMATGTNSAIEGYATTSGAAILGANSGSGDGVRGSTNGSSGAAVYGITTGSAAVGVYGYNNGGSNGFGVFGTSYLGGVSGIGVYGDSDAPTGYGMFAANTNASGTGIVATGNNMTPTILVTGSGGAFKGRGAGSVSFANLATGTGAIGVGNGGSAVTITGGSGGAFSGLNYGVFGNATINGAANDAVNRAAFVGNYYSVGTTTAAVYVGARVSGTAYKILGTGVVSTIMKTREGEKILFAPEATESWFFDMGEAQLVNGKATVVLDPVFVDCLSETKPFKVFVQGAENTMGSIRITRNQKDKTFVLEDLGGSSNGIVQYSIYGIWKGNENKRMPNFNLQDQEKQTVIETKEQDNSAAERIKNKK